MWNDGVMLVCSSLRLAPINVTLEPESGLQTIAFMSVLEMDYSNHLPLEL